MDFRLDCRVVHLHVSSKFTKGAALADASEPSRRSRNAALGPRHSARGIDCARVGLAAPRGYVQRAAQAQRARGALALSLTPTPTPTHSAAALLPAQVPSTFPEDLDKSQYTPESYVVENAKQKALEVHSRLTGTGEEPPQPRP